MGPRAMSYKQLFLLTLTIWSAELFTPFLFDHVIEMHTVIGIQRCIVTMHWSVTASQTRH